MQLLIALSIMVIIIIAIVVFTRYEPKLDLVKSSNKYILFLWYNKYNWVGEYCRRTYIKLFEV